jgi:hypothetical protein
MKTLELKLYKFDELDEETQDELIKKEREHLYKWVCRYGYDWEDEGKDSLDAFCKIFPVEWTQFDVQNTDIDFKITCDDEIKSLSGFRLQKYLWNNYRRDIYKGKFYWRGTLKGKSRHSKIQLVGMNCNLTGYCVDDDLLKPIYDFLDSRNPKGDFEDLLGDCLHAWVKGQCDELEYSYSEEKAREELIEAGEVYTEKGEVIDL